MCRDCGCSLGPTLARAPWAAAQPAPEALDAPGELRFEPVLKRVETIEVISAILGENERIAAQNRALFDRHGLLAVNLMSSPGAGKTSLLEATIRAVGDRLRMAVIEGDLATENDANRIRALGVRAVQITTGNACHLDAAMVREGLRDLPLAGLDVLFIENVGNLVCPASFALGTHRSVTLLSVPEGDDKPEKYPVMFRGADLALLTKTDLLAWIEEFDPLRARRSLRSVGYAGPVIELTKRGGPGLEAWLAWLSVEVGVQRSRAAAGEAVTP